MEGGKKNSMVQMFCPLASYILLVKKTEDRGKLSTSGPIVEPGPSLGREGLLDLGLVLLQDAPAVELLGRSHQAL